jgi:hypothetical protein
MPAHGMYASISKQRSERKETTMDDMTIAYRKPKANRYLRVNDWSGTGREAFDMIARIREGRPDLDMITVLADRRESDGFTRTASGHHVRIMEGGSLSDLITATAPSISLRTPRAGHEVTVQAEMGGVWVITDDGSLAGAMSFLTATELREIALGRYQITS